MTSESPILLVVEHDFHELSILTPRLQDGRYRLATCPVESVALEYVKESRPAAVLLDARALYLEGPGCVRRWTAASALTRVLFVDIDGPWCLLTELPDADAGDVTIHPCGVEDLPRVIEELLSRPPGADAGRREVHDGRLAVLAV